MEEDFGGGDARSQIFDRWENRIDNLAVSIISNRTKGPLAFRSLIVELPGQSEFPWLRIRKPVVPMIVSS